MSHKLNKDRLIYEMSDILLQLSVYLHTLFNALLYLKIMFDWVSVSKDKKKSFQLYNVFYHFFLLRILRVE